MHANHRFLSLVSVLLVCGACSPLAAAPRAIDLEALRGQLIGFYRGTAPDPARPGSTIEVYHKIVEVAAPQLGDAVVYHQIARDSFDSAQPLLQKFYVFDAAAPASGVLDVVVYAVKPRSLPGNLEQLPRELAQLTPSRLQAFPASCALVWRMGVAADTWIASAVFFWSERTKLIGAIAGPAAAAAGAMPTGFAFPTIEPFTIIALLLFFLLGYTFYAALFAAVGAMVGTQEEASQAV